MSSFSLSGVTRNLRGQPLGGVTVDIFDTATNTFQGTSVSDGSGGYTVIIGTGSNCYAVGYLTGSPDVAGTTLNTLVPVGLGGGGTYKDTWYLFGF